MDKKVQKAVKKQVISYIVAAFGLVAGLAWNEAIKALIDYFFPMTTSTLWAKLLYAMVVTLVVVLVAIYLTNLVKSEGEEK